MRTAHLRDLEVSRIGLGAMGMSGAYGAVTDEAECIRTIHRALDLGVTLLDTAEVYGPYHNEELVGRAIKDRRDEVVLLKTYDSDPALARFSAHSAFADPTFADPKVLRESIEIRALVCFD